MPGISQSVSMNVWYEISRIPDKDLRELAEKIFRLYDDNKFAEFGGLFVWVLCLFGGVLGMSAIRVPETIGLVIAMIGSIWPAYRYYQWRRRLSDQRYEQIIASHPRATEAARLVSKLYRDNHPFG